MLRLAVLDVGGELQAGGRGGVVAVAAAPGSGRLDTGTEVEEEGEGDYYGRVRRSDCVAWLVVGCMRW